MPLTPYEKWDSGPAEAPKTGNFLQNPGDQWLYWIDNPGVPNSAFPRGWKPWDITMTFDATSWITSKRGGAPCTVTWHVKLKWEEGVITRWQGTTDNPPR